MKDNLNSVLLEGTVEDGPWFTGGIFPRLVFYIKSVQVYRSRDKDMGYVRECGFRETVVCIWVEGSLAERLHDSIHKGTELRVIGRLVLLPDAIGLGISANHIELSKEEEEDA